MSPQLSDTFQALFSPAARLATLPMLALGVGVVLHLLCDVIDVLKPARSAVFLATLGVALFAELRILLAPGATGDSVLYGTLASGPDTALWGLLFLLSTLLAWVHSLGYYKENSPYKPEHDSLLLTAPVGMMLMVGARDLVVFFVGLELLSIPLYALAAFRRMRSDGVEAGLKYFLLGSFSSALFVYGAALVYAATGTLALADMAPAALGTPLALAGLALVAASLFFKVSVFPFHLWAPDVYQGSPTPVTALMATGTKAAAFGFLIVRLTPLLPAGGKTSVAVLALLTMALGNLGALMQGDLKRLLAYSSVAHAGTLLLLVAAGMGLPEGAAATSALVDGGAQRAALFYLGGYLFSAMGAFGLLALLESDGPRFTSLEGLRGLARTRPWLAAALTLFVLSLGGIPATAGFLGKWFVFAVLVRQDMIVVAVLGALLSVIALGYYLRVIVTLYMQPAPESAPLSVASRPLSSGLATLACAALVLAMGLLPAFFLDLIAR